MQQAIDIMMDTYSQFFYSSGLSLNQDKCSLLGIRSKRKTRTLFMNGIQEETKVKLLSFSIDSGYDFSEHLEYVIRWCSYKFSCLRKVQLYLSEKNMKLIMEFLDRSTVNQRSNYDFNISEPRHRKSARLVLNHNRFVICETMMQYLQWLNMNNHYRYQFLTSLHHILRTRASALTFSMLDWNTKLSNRIKFLSLA